MANADPVTLPDGYIGDWAQPENWNAIHHVLELGKRLSDEVEVENELYETPTEENGYNAEMQALIERGLNFGRYYWIDEIARPSLRLVQGASVLNFGYDAGTAAHKHWWRVVPKFSGKSWSSGVIGHLYGVKMAGNTWSTGEWTYDTYLWGYGWREMGPENECFSFGDGSGYCGMTAAENMYNGQTARDSVGFLSGYWVHNQLEASTWRVIVPKDSVLKHPVQKDTDTSNNQPALTWPEYDSESGRVIRDGLARDYYTQVWLNCVVLGDKTGEGLAACATLGNPPEPPYNEPVPLPGDPPEPGPTPGDPGSGCPAPLSTGLNFQPIWDADLLAKFPFGIFDWVHGVMSTWFAERHAPHFTLHVLGENMEVDLTNESPSMAIVRAVELVCTSVLAFWWFGTALLGLKGGGG